MLSWRVIVKKGFDGVLLGAQTTRNVVGVNGTLPVYSLGRAIMLL